MKKNIIFSILAFILISCKKEETIIHFNYYNDKNELLKNDDIYKSITTKDSVSICKNDRKIISFAYQLQKDGIYIVSNKKKFPLYLFNKKSFKRNDALLRFFRFNVRLLEQKHYKTRDNNDYLIYSFVESTGDNIFYSYYMVNEGFFCVYNYGHDKYLYSDSPKAKEISKLFLNDSTFFAKLDLERREKKLKSLLKGNSVHLDYRIK